MPSSISSSDPRTIPTGRWLATWLVAIAGAAAIVGACEYLARDHGQRPSVVDDPTTWAAARLSADGDPDVVAFVGTSRLELGYSARAFAAAAPGARGVQLAINGAPAEHVLADLAADEDFRGLAVVDVDEWDIAGGDFQGIADPYIARSHALWRAPGALANRWLGRAFEERLAVLAVGGRAIVTALLNGRWPRGRAIVAAADRSSHGDYALVPPESLEKTKTWRLANFAKPTPSPADWLARAAALEPAVRAIRAHGGDVAFVRFPVSGQLAAGFARVYPRAQYWDAFAAHSSAHVIHYLDVPAMASIVCPDDMHIDERDQDAFMRALVGALRAAHALR